MKKADIQRWAKQPTWYMLSEYTVAWVATESPHGAELAREWIDAKKPAIAASGWATWSGLVALGPDDELDLDELVSLLERVEAYIHKAPNRVRYTMNFFVIAVGS